MSRFQLYYYSDADHKKEERKETILTIDTRNLFGNGNVETDAEFDENIEPPLEKAIQTKWALRWS